MDAATTTRPKRWDEPFGDAMTNDDVDWIMQHSPFRDMDSSRFPVGLPLREIILNDCRINEYREGDIVIREGDYGNSAFLVMEGSVDVCLTSLPEKVLGRVTARKRGWFRALSQIWSNHRGTEYRAKANAIGNSNPDQAVGARKSKNGTRIFLQDVPRVLDGKNLVSIRPGSCLGRSLQYLVRREPQQSLRAEKPACWN